MLVQALTYISSSSKPGCSGACDVFNVDYSKVHHGLPHHRIRVFPVTLKVPAQQRCEPLALAIKVSQYHYLVRNAIPSAFVRNLFSKLRYRLPVQPRYVPHPEALQGVFVPYALNDNQFITQITEDARHGFIRNLPPTYVNHDCNANPLLLFNEYQ
jgi:hypothetical protein